MMRARRRMLWNGVVTGTLVLNREGGLCAVPAVSQTGISNEADAADYIAAASLAIEDALAAMGRPRGAMTGRSRKLPDRRCAGWRVRCSAFARLPISISCGSTPKTFRALPRAV